MKLIDNKWEDINGGKHRLYTVRSMGPGHGFGIVDRYRNIVITSFGTRAECWDYLRETDAD